MLLEDKKYTLDELQIGMTVKADQLSDILDTYIILTNVRLVKNEIGIGDFEGVVDAISDHYVPLTKPNSTIVYNDSYASSGCCEIE